VTQHFVSLYTTKKNIHVNLQHSFHSCGLNLSVSFETQMGRVDGHMGESIENNGFTNEN
jgi:hypothetical protein